MRCMQLCTYKLPKRAYEKGYDVQQRCKVESTASQTKSCNCYRETSWGKEFHIGISMTKSGSEMCDDVYWKWAGYV